jgi:hypothetical protein
MGLLKKLVLRFWPSGVLTLVGFLVIIYVALGILYIQQGTKQTGLEEQISKLSLVVAKPLASSEQLQAEYDAAMTALSPMTARDAIAMLVNIAEESGIDVDPDSDKFSVMPATVREEKLGEGNYRILSFKNISVEGDYESVMAFISDLDSGETLKTMVLRKVSVRQVEVQYEEEEEARRAEFRNIEAAVIAMMIDNGLSEIPHPLDYGAETVATNDMTVFPDFASDWGSIGGKVTDPDGTAYAAGDDLGYVLYGHDRTGGGAPGPSVNYVTMAQTTYYYTCEADGTVHQYDGPEIATATEYEMGAETSTVATVDVDIYTKPSGG